MHTMECTQWNAHNGMQVFLEHTKGAKGEELEREMFILRKVIEKAKAA